MDDKRFLVAETAPYEGCFEHWGPYTQEVAEEVREALQVKTKVFDYDVIELTPLTVEQAKGGQRGNLK